jgi:hypothetical protein
MESMRESWTDGRLDDLNRRIDGRFDQVDERFDRVEADLRAHRVETRTEFAALRGEMNNRFDRVEARFDGLQRTLIQVGGGMAAAFGAALIGLIATQL